MRSLSCHYLVGVLAVVLLAHSEGDVAVLDHMLDLLAHGQDKEDNPVEDEYWPEDGDVEDLEPGADEANGNSASGPVPELELGKTADEGLELFVSLGRQGADGSILHVILEVIVGGVELGLEEGEEEVQQVDAESIRDDIPSLGEENAEEEEEQGNAGTDPAVQDERRRLIQQGLVLSLEVRGVGSDSRERGLFGFRRIHGG